MNPFEQLLSLQVNTGNQRHYGQGAWRNPNNPSPYRYGSGGYNGSAGYNGLYEQRPYPPTRVYSAQVGPNYGYGHPNHPRFESTGAYGFVDPYTDAKKPHPVGTPIPSAQELRGQMMHVGYDGRPLPLGRDGRPVGPDGLPVGPDGRPLPQDRLPSAQIQENLARLEHRKEELKDYVVPPAVDGSGQPISTGSGGGLVSRSPARIAFEGDRPGIPVSGDPAEMELSRLEREAAALPGMIGMERRRLAEALSREAEQREQARLAAEQRQRAEQAQNAVAGTPAGTPVGQTPQPPKTDAAADPTPLSPSGKTVPVRAGDSLSRICSKNCPEGVDATAYMAMTYAANQDKFKKGHPHSIRAGEQLSMPDPKAVEAFSKSPEGQAMIQTMKGYLSQQPGHYAPLASDPAAAIFAKMIHSKPEPQPIPPVPVVPQASEVRPSAPSKFDSQAQDDAMPGVRFQSDTAGPSFKPPPGGLYKFTAPEPAVFNPSAQGGSPILDKLQQQRALSGEGPEPEAPKQGRTLA